MSAPSGNGNGDDDSLPELTPFEFRQWNRLADRMDVFHSHFKSNFRQIWDDCVDVDLASDRQIKRFCLDADELYQHLCMHHGIEEAHVFPILAKKMPQFKNSPAGSHLKEHEKMHAGLEKYHEYLSLCRKDTVEFSPERLRKVMSDFENTLFGHMDAEVESLGAESMRKSGWTLEELRRMPM